MSTNDATAAVRQAAFALMDGVPIGPRAWGWMINRFRERDNSQRRIRNVAVPESDSCRIATAAVECVG